VKKLLTAAAVTAAALLATSGVASAHEAEASCIEGTDTYTVAALTSEPGFGWVDNGDGTWTATWGDGFVLGPEPVPEACPTPSSSPPAEPTTTTHTVESTAPVTTAPPETSTPAAAGPGAPTTSVASSRTLLPETGTNDAAIGFTFGAAVGLIGAGAAIIITARRRSDG
jgi:LPXTG-motif cell wall-anchored protein